MTALKPHHWFASLLRRKAAERSSTEKKSSGTWRYAPVMAMVLASLLITGYTFQTVHRWETDRVQQAFSEAARDRYLVIQSEIEHALGVVRDVASFFDASPAVGRREFRKFVGPSLVRHFYIKILEWIPRVSGAERELFVN
jgi:CHASE1-domain containing sensor protein